MALWRVFVCWVQNMLGCSRVSIKAADHTISIPPVYRCNSFSSSFTTQLLTTDVGRIYRKENIFVARLAQRYIKGVNFVRVFSVHLSHI